MIHFFKIVVSLLFTVKNVFPKDLESMLITGVQACSENFELCCSFGSESKPGKVFQFDLQDIQITTA